MTSPYYPVFLELRGRPCAVIGGGEVAERKVKGLLECGARVTVISPAVTEGIRDLAGQSELEWKEREYLEGDLKGVFLAIAGTDQRIVNSTVAMEAARERVILNVVDDAPQCTFIAPAVVRRGKVIVAVSTGGASPALARKLKESLEASEALEYAHLAEVLSSARKVLKQRRVEVHPDRWQECITGELVSLVKAGRSEEALDQLLSSLTKRRPLRARGAH